MGTPAPIRARALLVVNIPALYHVAENHGLLFSRSELRLVIRHYRDQLQRITSRYELDVCVFRYNHGDYSMWLARQLSREGIRVILVDYKESTIDDTIWDYLIANGRNYDHIALAGGYNIREMGETKQLADLREDSWLHLYSFFPNHVPALAKMDFDRVYNLFPILGHRPRSDTGLQVFDRLVAKQAC